MSVQPYFADRSEVAEAVELMRLFGAEAESEAANRAWHSRDVGNHAHFCRWRQVERLIILLSVRRASGTVH